LKVENVGADIIRPFFIGLDYNPSVICFANATSLCTREAALRVTWESLFRQPSADTFPSGKADCLGGKRRRNPPL